MLYRSLPTAVPAPALPLLLKRRRNGMMWGEEIACRLAESSVTRRFACVLATLLTLFGTALRPALRASLAFMLSVTSCS